MRGGHSRSAAGPRSRRSGRNGGQSSRSLNTVYFDRNSPGRIVFQESVDNIAIKYARSDFHNINSGTFYDYWIGRLNFSKASRKQISVSQSWAKSRIIIDRETVFDPSNESGKFVHDFSSDDHVVEVEYANNWHAVEYKVTLQDVVRTLLNPDVANHL